jgi:NAD(P)-dependent dehydrogenase (short-subunit alcohol dehydrogenase family)
MYNGRLMPLEGRVALITGASRGLGKAMSLALATSGSRLALVGRDAEALAAVASEARALGAEAEPFRADITDEDQVFQLERDVSSRLGPVEILVNNAGINIRKNCVDYTLAEWNSVLHTNLTSVFLMCRAFVPHMKSRRWGRIINIASIMGHISFPQRTIYSATKAGVLGFTRSLALELAQENITAVAISPGPFATEMTIPIMNDPQRNEEFMSRTPLRRWGRPEELGKLVVFLCSEDASFITGSDVLVDGGWCAQ